MQPTTKHLREIRTKLHAINEELLENNPNFDQKRLAEINRLIDEAYESSEYLESKATISIEKNGKRLMDIPAVINLDNPQLMRDLTLMCEDPAKELVASVCETLGADLSSAMLEDGDSDAHLLCIKCTISWLESLGVTFKGAING